MLIDNVYNDNYFNRCKFLLLFRFYLILLQISSTIIIRIGVRINYQTLNWIQTRIEMLSSYLTNSWIVSHHANRLQHQRKTKSSLLIVINLDFGLFLALFPFFSFFFFFFCYKSNFLHLFFSIFLPRFDWFALRLRMNYLNIFTFSIVFSILLFG